MVHFLFLEEPFVTTLTLVDSFLEDNFLKEKFSKFSNCERLTVHFTKLLDVKITKTLYLRCNQDFTLHIINYDNNSFI